MDSDRLAAVAAMLEQRNAIDANLGAIIGRPMTSGHLGEWIASQVFDVELEAGANAKAIDGRFRSGPMGGKSVNIKWYLKREGMLDVTTSDLLDYYLVLSGPIGAGAARGDTVRPWRIDAVYLFDARALLDDLTARGVRLGVATSVRNALWEAAEIFPRAGALSLTEEQRAVLQGFGFGQEPG